MNEKKETICDLKRLGGLLCLDFINTLDWRGARQPVEYMHTYEDLALWSHCAGVAGESEVAALLQTAWADAAKADRIVKAPSNCAKPSTVFFMPLFKAAHRPPVI